MYVQSAIIGITTYRLSVTAMCVDKAKRAKGKDIAGKYVRQVAELYAFCFSLMIG